MPNQETLWTQYLAALASKVALQAGEALQAIYPFQPWNWGGRTPVSGSFPFEQWETLNVVPSDPYQNTNAGAAASQRGFDTAYSNWFNTLAIGDLEHDTHYQQLQDHFNQAVDKYNQDYRNAQNLWRNQGSSPDFIQWLAQPGQFALSAQLDEDKAGVQGQQAELDEYRSQIKTPVAAIQAAYNDPSYQGLSTDPESGKSVSLRLWETAPANAFEHVETITGNNFGGDATAGYRDSLEVTYSSEQYDYSKYYAEAGGGWWDDFIGAGAAGSYERIQWSKFSDNYSLEMDFQDLSTVSVTPDAWYAGANITSYGAGPYATGFSAFNSGTGNYFFGPGGALSRICTGFVVAYRPSITVEAGEQFATYLHEQWQAEGGIEIGPFFFGAESSGETTHSTAEVSGAKLILTSKADWPMIIAMKSAWTLPPSN